jgi:hypothetical protein
MSIGTTGVHINRKNRHIFVVSLLIGVQFCLSVLLYISFAAHLVWPDTTSGAVGVSQMLSYEGRLTDSSGNPLGGTGEPYCYRFSIYNDGVVGAPDTKLWPAGTPNTTKATTTDGVFNALIGQADTLDYNFYDSDTVYLNVEVNTATSTCAGTWENLGPRQAIVATGYAITSRNVYGDLLKTDIANSRVQIGTGAGAASPKFLGLDVKNTADYVGQSCTTSGTVWYNSAVSKAFVCENSVIQAVSNASATTTIAALTANTGTPATTGTVVFSNANGVTFGINGNTITASVNAGGGGGATVSSTVFGMEMAWAQSSSSLGQNSVYIFPEVLGNYVSGSAIKIPVLITASSNTSASRQVGYTANFGVYTRHATNSTVLSLHYSTSYTAAVSFNSNASMAFSGISAIGNSTSYNTFTSSSAGLNLSSIVHGARELIMPFNSVMAPGEYWFAYRASSSSAGGAIANAFSVSHIIASSQTGVRIGQAVNATNNGIARNIGLGTYSATSGALPNGISMTQINQAATWPIVYFMSATS